MAVVGHFGYMFHGDFEALKWHLVIRDVINAFSDVWIAKITIPISNSLIKAFPSDFDD